MTTATERLIVTTSFIGSMRISGITNCGSPGSTADSVWIPHSLTGKNFVITAPAAIKSTAIGNFGITFFDTRSIRREMPPKIRDGRFTFVCPICSASSMSSPTPAVPPINFGTCIRIIVVQIPVINPPITGAEI